MFNECWNCLGCFKIIRDEMILRGVSAPFSWHNLPELRAIFSRVETTDINQTNLQLLWCQDDCQGRYQTGPSLPLLCFKKICCVQDGGLDYRVAADRRKYSGNSRKTIRSLLLLFLTSLIFKSCLGLFWFFLSQWNFTFDWFYFYFIIRTASTQILKAM